MRTLLIIAAGIWLGKQIYGTVYENWTVAREAKLRKRLRQFMQQHLPALSDTEIQQALTTILK